MNHYDLESSERLSYVTSIGRFTIIHDPESNYQVLDESLPFDRNCIASEMESRAEAEAFVAEQLAKIVGNQ